MSHVLVIGALTFDADSGEDLAFDVEYESARKVDEKAGEDENDAEVTDKGREARKITIRFSWPNRERVNTTRGAAIVSALDPSNPKPGDPPAYAHENNGLDLGSLKRVTAIKIKSAKGPTVGADGRVTYEVQAVSWVKNPPKPGATTAKEAQRFVLGSDLERNNHWTAKGPAKPAVKP